jgi:hypothetical protein
LYGGNLGFYGQTNDSVSQSKENNDTTAAQQHKVPSQAGLVNILYNMKQQHFLPQVQ